MSLDAVRARAALEQGEFVPFFQPVIAIRTGKLVGFEVLARWNDPKHGLVLPDSFIPVAERDGWIAELTMHMMRQAFRAAASLPSTVDLAFNIPAQQLHDPLLPKQIADIAAESGYPLKCISLELTESALVWDFETAREVAGELKAMGCKLALDDFGTGYSSLRSLQSLPFDVLKVDRSFVGSMTTNKESRKIVAAVVGLGQSLGITTVPRASRPKSRMRCCCGWGVTTGRGGCTAIRCRRRDWRLCSRRRAIGAPHARWPRGCRTAAR
jgi:EAL domain-containing protein (putative c-di-GMP-specific phosphodiesterase class I)